MIKPALEIIELARNLGQPFLILWLGCLGLMMLGTCLVCLWLFFRAKKPLHICFAVSVFCLGLMYSFVLPPLSAPDEVAHYISAYKLSSMMLGEPVMDAEHQILIRRQDVFIDDLPNDGDPDNATVVGAKLQRSTYQELHMRGLGSTGETGIVFSQQIPVSTTPFAYLPQALGFALARLLNLGGFGLLYLGRLMNLLLFTLVGAFAVKRIPVGKEILFGIALFPMSLHLASSLSYDTYILALAFYLTALCTELATTTHGSITGRDVLLIALLAVLLAPCKMVYALLFGMCFLIPARKWKDKKRYVLSIVLVAVLMLAAIVLVNAEQLFKYTNVTESVNEVSWAGEGVQSYSLVECLQDPALLVSLLFTTLWLKGGEFLGGMVGHWMGNLDPVLEIPYPTIVLFWGLLLFLALRKRYRPLPAVGKEMEREAAQTASYAEEPQIFRPGQRLWLVLLSFLVVAAVCISMLAAYTPKGEIYIRGIQGRYFLAALPMLLLAVKSMRLTVPDSLQLRLPFALKNGQTPRLRLSLTRLALFAMGSINAWVLLRLYRIVCFRN